MASILKNAADSIELGIEDIRSQDPKRAISAIRNFYSGMLLLGKECLLSRAPGADPKILLASRHRPVSDGIGGIRFEAKGNATIDVAELEETMTNTIRTSGFQALTSALIEARKAAGMTQRDLAQRLGCQPATVANIETGQRRVDVIELVALANALGVSPRGLFDRVVESVDASELVDNFSRSKKGARGIKKNGETLE